MHTSHDPPLGRSNGMAASTDTQFLPSSTNVPNVVCQCNTPLLDYILIIHEAQLIDDY